MGRAEHYKSPSKKLRSMGRVVSFLKSKLNFLKPVSEAKPELSLSPVVFENIQPTVPVLAKIKNPCIDIPASAPIPRINGARTSFMTLKDFQEQELNSSHNVDRIPQLDGAISEVHDLCHQQDQPPQIHL